MDVPLPPSDGGEKARWSRTARRLLILLVFVIVISVLISTVSLPIFDRTRDARYEVVSLEQDYWVHRDGRFDMSFRQQFRTGSWCAFYDYAIITLVERDGMPGGTYRIQFDYPTYRGIPIVVTLGPRETEVITSDEICASSPGENVISNTFLASPPRVYEKYDGVEGNNPDYELKGTLTLREIEGIGGEYVISFRLSAGQGVTTVRGQLSPASVREFDVSFEVPNGTCCGIEYSINAPKVQEKASLASIAFG